MSEDSFGGRDTMGDDRQSNPGRAWPKLRRQFRLSHALTIESLERARRAMDTSRALRALFQARTWTDGQGPWQPATQELARIERERDRVFGPLSHELRQVLNAALFSEQLLGRTADPQAVARARDVLHRQLLHMTRLVEDLLDFSRSSLDGGKFERRAVDFRAIVAQAVETIQSAVGERRLQLSLTQPRDPPIVTGDPTRLQRVVSNLLHNAARYTSEGGCIVVSIGSDEHDVTLEVRDTGDGIDPEDLAVIFEPFARRSPNGSRLGVGLALAKRLVELHGGTIAAQSEGRGLGSVFTVRLPLSQSP